MPVLGISVQLTQSTALRVLNVLLPLTVTEGEAQLQLQNGIQIMM